MGVKGNACCDRLEGSEGWWYSACIKSGTYRDTLLLGKKPVQDSNIIMSGGLGGTGRWNRSFLLHHRQFLHISPPSAKRGG